MTFWLTVPEPSESHPSGLVRSLVVGALAGAIGSAIGAVAMGTMYVMEHADEDVEWARIVPPFLTFMLSGGILFGAALRAGATAFDRRPVVASSVFGALACMLPGAIAAREFGVQPLPFVGSDGIFLATVPPTLALAFASARESGRRVLRPALVAFGVTFVLTVVVALAGSLVQGPPLLEILRAFLFLGIEQVGTLAGALLGFAIGLTVGLAVLLERMAERHAAHALHSMTQR